MDLNSWQSLLPDSLALSMVNMPGTHDSLTQYVKLSPFSRCQNKSIRQQLQMGIRFLDIRLFLKDDRFYGVHGIADCRTGRPRRSPLLCFDDVFCSLISFLEKHPSEFIVLLLNVGRGDNGDDFFNAFYSKFIEPARSHWFLENRIPLLSECRGKLVLFRRCGLGKPESAFNDRNTGINLTAWPDQTSTKISSALPCSIESVENNSVIGAAVVQDRYMLNPIAKWKKAIIKALDNAEPDDKTVYIHFFSTAGIPFIPRVNSKYVNSKFMKYKLINKKSYGWFSHDFPSETLIGKIAECNF